MVPPQEQTVLQVCHVSRFNCEIWIILLLSALLLTASRCL
jgi:hypothetical protein